MAIRPEIWDHLQTDYTAPIRDPLWGHIYLSPAMLHLVNTTEFQQLSRIKQLGPTFLVYPGATHTRLNHSLGVFHLARRILTRLISHADAPALTLEGVKAFLAAALLHDVGHFPYTHSFKSLPLAEHEHLTGRIIQSGEIQHHLKEDLRVDPALVAAIVDETLDADGAEEVLLYRRLLSGSLDPDKLDYLNRDAYFCGVPYGLQDIDFAISRIRPVGFDGIGLDETGVSAVENILFSKFLMYRAVYWHRTVRVATAMIKKAVHMGLAEHVIRPEDLYGLDDELFVARFGDDPYPPFELIAEVGLRRLLKPVATVPFDPIDPRHQAIDDIAVRHELEAELAKELGIPEHRVIIDLPDPISFEAHFPIFEDGYRYEFSEKSVFSGDVVRTFTETLRRIRLMIPRDALGSGAETGETAKELLECTLSAVE
ncbi:MAG: HD domain-containing protein [Spirochaeta sp.]|jgi:HD superfamily phosphohydrolase|nr:HD domain-containing protein [Spirochaeta sp.]